VVVVVLSPLAPSTAQRTLAGQHDVPLVRALRAGAFPRAVDGRAEEVGARVYARGVDVVVLGEVAHCGTTAFLVGGGAGNVVR
jgi:hypothetical protein